MKLLLIALFSSGLAAQSCSHTTSRTPTGPLMVFRNGALLVDTTDYVMGTTLGATTRTINPRTFGDKDHMAVAMTTVLTQTLTMPGGQSLQYSSYQLWREDWVCSGSTPPPPPPPPSFPGCVPDGTQGIQCAGGFSVAPGGTAGALVLSNDSNTGNFAMSTAAAAGPFTMLLMPSCADGLCFGKFLHNLGAVPCPNLHPSIAKFNPTCQQAEWAVPGQ